MFEIGDILGYDGYGSGYHVVKILSERCPDGYYKALHIDGKYNGIVAESFNTINCDLIEKGSFFYIKKSVKGFNFN